jgi:hypothetical protein
MRTRGCNIKNRGRRGQAGLFIALNLTLVFGTLGLAVDVGFAYYTRQSAQAAADAAAMAAVAYASSSGAPVCGTGGVTCNSTATSCSNPPVSPATNALQVGCLYAQTNGFVNNGTTQFVSMAANTTAPPGIGNNSPSYWVQAKVTSNPFTMFGRFAGISAFTINASSIAAVTYYNAGACIYAVGSGNIPQEFSATGGTNVNASCGIFVNSTSGSGFYEYGSPTVKATQIQVNASADSVSSSSSVSPSPTLNAGPQPDPLSTYTLPTFSSVCPSPPYSVYSLATNTSVANVPSGNYCGGIDIHNSQVATFTGGTYNIYNGLTIEGNSTAKFDSGLYIINGQSSNNTSVAFTNSATVSGTGVTFFITGQYSVTGYTHTIGPVEMTGNTTVNLAAPTSGTYQGMLFLQDRNLSYATANSFANSATSVLQGTLYFPTTAVSYSGASATGTYTALIGKTVSISGSAAFKNDPTGEYTGLATTIRGLIQ